MAAASNNCADGYSQKQAVVAIIEYDINNQLRNGGGYMKRVAGIPIVFNLISIRQSNRPATPGKTTTARRTYQKAINNENNNDAQKQQYASNAVSSGFARGGEEVGPAGT
jgi:hypothetical protein